jgi:hypothetical protein
VPVGGVTNAMSTCGSFASGSVDRAAALGGVRRLGEIRPLRLRLLGDRAEVLLDERHRLLGVDVADDRQARRCSARSRS